MGKAGVRESNNVMGKKQRNWQDDNSESNKVVLKDRQKNFIHPIVQSNGEDMVISVKSHCQRETSKN